MSFFAKVRDTKEAWRKQSTLYLWYCVLSFALGSIMYGLDTSIFASIQALPSFLKDFAPINDKGKHAFPTKVKSTMNSVVWPGKLVGICIFEPLVERIGYRNLLYVVCVIQCVGLFVEVFAKSWQMFAVGRVFCYMAIGVCEGLIPSYLSEIAPAELRGFFSGLVNLVVVLGNTWGGAMGTAYAKEQSRKGWIVCVCVQYIPVVAIALCVPWTPEPPRWLLSHNRYEAAQKTLDRLRPARDVAEGRTTLEIEAIHQTIQEASLTGKGRWRDLLKGNYPRRAFIAAMVFCYHQTTGLQFIGQYGPTYFKTIGLGERAFSLNTAIISLGVVASFIILVLVDIVGRRHCLFFGATLTIIFQAVFGGLGTKKELSDADVNTIVASLALAQIGIKVSFNPLCYIISSELGGVRMRRKIISIGVVSDVLWALIITYVIPYMLDALQSRVGFVFAGINMTAVIFTIFCVPELTGRSLEEVDELFERKLPAWKFATAETSGTGALIRNLEKGQVQVEDKTPGGGEEVGEEDKRDANMIELVENQPRV